MVEVKETPASKKRTRRSAGAADGAKKRQLSAADGTKQSYLGEDFKPFRDKQIDAKGSELIEAMDQRRIWLEKIKPLQEALIDMMTKKKIDEYLLEVDSRTFKIALCKTTSLKSKRLKITPDEA